MKISIRGGILIKFHPTGIPPKTPMEWIKEQNKKLKKKKPNKKPASCHPVYLKAVPSASNKFSVKMYKEVLREKRDGFLQEMGLLGEFRSSEKSSKNMVMSAFSVFTVLSMLRLGAQGDTKKQITEALSGPRVAKCCGHC